VGGFCRSRLWLAVIQTKTRSRLPPRLRSASCLSIRLKTATDESIVF